MTLIPTSLQVMCCYSHDHIHSCKLLEQLQNHSNGNPERSKSNQLYIYHLAMLLTASLVPRHSANQQSKIWLSTA